MRKQKSNSSCLTVAFLFLTIIFFNSISMAHNWTTSDIIKRVTNGNLRFVISLINNEDTDPHLKDFRVSIILTTAADTGQKKIIQFLLNSENIHLTEFDLHSGLILAIERGHKKIAQLFIAFGVDIDRQDEYDNKQTPLMAAAEHGQKDMAQLLIDSGADIDLQDADDRSALIIALDKGREDIAQLLIDSGAEASFQDVYGRNAFKIASAKNYTEITNRLAHLPTSTNTKNPDHTSISNSITTTYDQLVLIRTQGKSCLRALSQKVKI